MRRDCVVRRVGGDEICFDAHRHAWAQPGKGVQRLQGLAQGCAAGILRIIRAGHAGDDPNGTYGAKSIGEPAMEMIAPAIANAIYNATGRRLRTNPASLENTLLGKKLTR